MAWSSASAHRNAAHMACGAEQLVSGAEMGAHTVGLGPGLGPRLTARQTAQHHRGQLPLAH